MLAGQLQARGLDISLYIRHKMACTSLFSGCSYTWYFQYGRFSGFLFFPFIPLPVCPHVLLFIYVKGNLYIYKKKTVRSIYLRMFEDKWAFFCLFSFVFVFLSQCNPVRYNVTVSRCLLFSWSSLQHQAIGNWAQWEQRCVYRWT